MVRHPDPERHASSQCLRLHVFMGISWCTSTIPKTRGLAVKFGARKGHLKDVPDRFSSPEHRGLFFAVPCSIPGGEGYSSRFWVGV